MKRILVGLGTVIVEFIFIYLLFSFAQWNFNPSGWGIDSRVGFGILFGIISFFSVFLVTVLDDDF